MVIEKQYIDDKTGKKIIVAFNDFGYRCGYVVVDNVNIIPKPNRLYHNTQAKEKELRVHGGVTFKGEHSLIGKTVIGFDCAHYFDSQDLKSYAKYYNNPEMLNTLRDRVSIGRKAWTVADVSKECESLAEQIKLVEDLYNHTRKMNKRNKWKHKGWR